MSKTELVIFPLPNRLLPWPPASYSADNEILEWLLIHPLYHCMLSVFLQNGPLFPSFYNKFCYFLPSSKTLLLYFWIPSWLPFL